jgi:hypothetical protein
MEERPSKTCGVFQSKIHLRYCASGWFYYRNREGALSAHWRGYLLCSWAGLLGIEHYTVKPIVHLLSQLLLWRYSDNTSEWCGSYIYARATWIFQYSAPPFNNNCMLVWPLFILHDCLAVAVPKDRANFVSRGSYVGFKDVSLYIFQHTTFVQKQYQVGEILWLNPQALEFFWKYGPKNYLFIRIITAHQLQKCVCVLQSFTRSPMIGTYLTLTLVTSVLYISMLADFSWQRIKLWELEIHIFVVMSDFRFYSRYIAVFLACDLTYIPRTCFTS